MQRVSSKVPAVITKQGAIYSCSTATHEHTKQKEEESKVSTEYMAPFNNTRLLCPLDTK